ncbi:MAG: hypothetical protein GY924_13975, partial [Planctomycetaceae bacterium]|nr:hypothetical protein [Planctomycetaceae bacterium]
MNRTTIISICITAMLHCYWVASVHSQEPTESQTQPVTINYLTQIKPLLAEKCYSCHGALKQESELRLETVDLMQSGGDSGPAVKPGNSADSLLLQRMTQIVTSETAVATDVSTNESATAVSDQKMVTSRLPNTMRPEPGNILA